MGALGWGALGLALLSVAGCGGGGGGISDQPLSGKIDGMAWTLVSAQSNPDQSTGDSFFVEMYAEAQTACSFGEPGRPNGLLADLPKTVGSYDIGPGSSVTFYVMPYTSLGTNNGHIVIDEVTETTISGGMEITYNGSNKVNGKFQATICP